MCLTWSLRVEKALDIRKVDHGAIEKIAALACRETGDARKAIELLTRAVRAAEEGSGILTEIEVDLAESLLEEDKTQTLTRSLPTQQKAVLLACYLLLSEAKMRLSTGDVYEKYRDVSARLGVRPLTQRRMSDMIGFLDLYGLVNARVVSKGRYGKTREITSAFPVQTTAKLKAELLDLLNLGK